MLRPIVCKSYWILDNFMIKNLMKSKQNVLGELGLFLLLLKSSQWVGFYEWD